jgi:hypothetical protein
MCHVYGDAPDEEYGKTDYDGVAVAIAKLQARLDGGER